MLFTNDGVKMKRGILGFILGLVNLVIVLDNANADFPSARREASYQSVRMKGPHEDTPEMRSACTQILLKKVLKNMGYKNIELKKFESPSVQTDVDFDRWEFAFVGGLELDKKEEFKGTFWSATDKVEVKYQPTNQGPAFYPIQYQYQTECRSAYAYLNKAVRTAWANKTDHEEVLEFESKDKKVKIDSVITHDLFNNP